MTKRNTYMIVDVVKQGNSKREEFTLAELRLIRQAIGMACADNTDEGKRLEKKYIKILNKLNEVAK